MNHCNGNVYGEPYYTVRPMLDDFPTDQAIATWNEMVTWCVENYGPSDHNSPGNIAAGHRWYVNNAMFWIKDQDDLIMFKLRWGI